MKDPSKFFNILDKQHSKVIQTSKSRKAAGRDWDLFKVKTRHGDTKSQMSRTLNHKNLEGLQRKVDSLSVMGHQKDVKENAYS